MKRIILDIIQDNDNKTMRVEVHSETRDPAYPLEDKLHDIVKDGVVKVLSNIPIPHGIGIGENMEECRDMANLQIDVIRAVREEE